MTNKELLYVEDALGHEQYVQSQCCQTAQMLQDRELQNFVQQLEQSHRSIFFFFFGLL